MSSRRLERRVGAYRDGSLSAREAEALRRELDSDPEARSLLARHEALGRLMRDAWVEGPPAPRTDHLIASLRIGMARIDAELADAPPLRWRSFVLPLPALGVGLAAVLAVVVLRGSTPPSPGTPGEAPARIAAAAPELPPASASTATAEAASTGEIPVYDLAQGDSPLMLFEDGGTTFIWLMEPERAREDLSALPDLHFELV